MDCSIILTYRCNSKCSMCNVWKNPSVYDEEISLKTLENISNHLGTINLTGGEPTLRRDLFEIVDLLYPKAQKLEISSNGLLPGKLEPIIQKYPEIKIRFSLEGFEINNNLIRGEKNGFDTKVKGLLRLKELGGTDLGFAITIQDDNVKDLVGLFNFTEDYGFELSTSTLHNGFQFHKTDNTPYDRIGISRFIEDLIVEQLKTNSIKNWFRAYLNLGLIAKVLGNDRLLPCRSGYEGVFIDPWGDIFACNVRPDLFLGNLGEYSWDEILSGPKTQKVLEKVDECTQNCWMVGSAKSAMRNSRLQNLPQWQPFIWVVNNKIRLGLNKKIKFDQYIDYSSTIVDNHLSTRLFYLNSTARRNVQRRNEFHYGQPDSYKNR